MTDLSYTAWDDNKYQWPPPDGWYQASDGKWWPEGYGPVAAQADASAGESDGSPDPDGYVDDVGSGGSDSSDGFDGDATEQFDVAEHAHSETEWATDDVVEHVAAEDVAAEQVAVDDVVVDDVDAGDVDTDHYGEIADGDADADGRDQRFDDQVEASSTAGMAESGFSSQTEDDASSLGLAGWVQTGESDIRGRVDAGVEYDYSGSADDAINDAADGVDGDQIGESFDSAEGFDTDADVGGDVTEAMSSFDMPAAPVDGPLSRLDDLKRQVEQQSFSVPPAAPSPDDVTAIPQNGFALDPTQTLDIDPRDLGVDPSPSYGGPDAFEWNAGTDPEMSAAATADVTVPDIAAQGLSNWESSDVATTELDDNLLRRADDHGRSEPISYGFDAGAEPPVDSSVDLAHPVDPPDVNQDVGGAISMSEQPPPSGEAYAGSQAGYGSDPVLTPMSSPTPPMGMGRVILYGVIGLLALAVAAVAGYMLFQLRGDDDTVTPTTTDSSDDADSAENSQDAGSDPAPTQQGPGSFSDPHELTGGVRVSVEVDGGKEVWMLQVREPATTSDGEGDRVEVMSRVRVRNDGTLGERPLSGLGFILVPADGGVATQAAGNCAAGDDLDMSAMVAQGQDVEGNVCFTVPADEATDALLGIQSVHAVGTVHVQLS